MSEMSPRSVNEHGYGLKYTVPYRWRGEGCNLNAAVDVIWLERRRHG